MDRVVVSRLLLSKKQDEAVAAQHLLADAAARSQDERDEAVSVLIAALKRDERRVQQRMRAAWWAIVSVPLIFGMVGVWSAWHNARGFTPPFWVLWLFGPGIRNNTFQRRARRCSKTRARVALALAEHNDLRALGPLVEVYDANLPEAPRYSAVAALNNLLPHVSPGDTVLLNDRQRDAMNTLLKQWHPVKRGRTTAEEAEGFVALLRVAALTGDEDTEPALVSARNRLTATGTERLVTEAARLSLETLRARLEGPATAGGPPRFRARP